MDYTEYLKCRILQHCLAKLDARKVMIELGVQFNLCKINPKSSGGEAAAPPMMFEEVYGVQLICKQSKQ